MLLVLIADILLICGAAGRMVSLYVSGQLDKMEDLLTIMWDLVMSETELVEIDVKTINMLLQMQLWYTTCPLVVNPRGEFTLTTHSIFSYCVILGN